MNEEELVKEEVAAMKTLSERIDELTKTLNKTKETAESKIRENPLAYLTGAFIVGLTLGCLVKKNHGTPSR